MDAPFGLLLIATCLFSGMFAFIGYMAWSSGLGFLEVFLYFAISCTILSGLSLLYLSFCILSKKYLKNKIKTKVEYKGYREQIKNNVKILLTPELFQNSVLKIILLFIILILAMSIVGFTIWFIVSLIILNCTPIP